MAVLLFYRLRAARAHPCYMQLQNVMGHYKKTTVYSIISLSSSTITAKGNTKRFEATKAYSINN
jgi:hypothetical protein